MASTFYGSERSIPNRFRFDSSVQLPEKHRDSIREAADFFSRGLPGSAEAARP